MRPVQGAGGRSLLIIADPNAVTFYEALGAEAIGNPQPEFAAFVKQEAERWSRIIREKGIKPA